MPVQSYDTDGAYNLEDVDQGVRRRFRSTVLIQSNLDGATVALGRLNSAGTFVQFPDGTITNGSVVNHGSAIALYINFTGIGSNPVVIEISR